jgi:putative peptidoglycan lipid II flippase
MSLARNTAVIGGLTLISRLFGFARDLALAAALGAGPVADAFFAALRFPNLFRRLFAEGAFSQAFIPVYSKTLAAEGEEAANRMASEALSILLLMTGVLSAVAIAGMSWINRALFAGYAGDPHTFQLATLLTQLSMPYLVSMSAATLFSGVLNAHGKFFAAAAAPILFNLCQLTALGWSTTIQNIRPSRRSARCRYRGCCKHFGFGGGLCARARSLVCRFRA